MQCTDFVFNPHGHGWHLNRARFDAMLRDEARAAGSEVLSGARFTSAIHEHGGWRITIRTGYARPELRAHWLIDATGRRSFVARKLGADRIHDDRLLAFFIRFCLSGSSQRDVDARTFVEAAPDGWWYTALVPSGERVVAFLTDADLIERAELLSTTGFAKRLDSSRYVRSLLAAHGYEPVGPPRGADAGTGRLDPIAGASWVAVGDAAVSFDPLSSQGILTALFTGFRAGKAIDCTLRGDASDLDEYVRQVNEIYRANRRDRAAYYAVEGRWLHRPFWRRRLEDSVTPRI
jgi:flavin-dependent dehydrogenase